MEMMNKLKSEIVQKRQIFKQQRKNLKKEMLMIFMFKKNKISKIEGLFNKEKILLVFLFLRLLTNNKKKHLYLINLRAKAEKS